jgi:hypothetical protein
MHTRRNSQRIPPDISCILTAKYKRGRNTLGPIELLPVQQNQEHYEPEKIIAHEIDKATNETIFLVSWKGYPLDKATWEPFDLLYPGTEEVLRMFYKNNPTVKPHK